MTHETYTVATELLAGRCTNRSPYPSRCENAGEGWLYEPTRPPAYGGLQYVCRDCADRIVKEERVVFTPGRVQGGFRILDMRWSIRVDSEEWTMGYRHHWTFARDLTGQEFEDIRKAARQVVKQCGVPLANRSGQHGTMPELTDEAIVFNGVGEDGGEALVIERAQPIRSYSPDLDDYYHYCTTERRPYDAAVGAVLLAAKSVLEEDMVLSSDGFREEWLNGPHAGTQGAARVYQRIFGDDPDRHMKNFLKAPQRKGSDNC